MQKVFGDLYLISSAEGQVLTPNLGEHEREGIQAVELGSDAQRDPAHSLGECSVESSGLLREDQA